MLTMLIFLGVLSALVLIHEAGHYLAARWFGVKADEFGYGFPPRLVGFVKDQGVWKRVGRDDDRVYASTIWSLNWLPLGGFVRIKGEQGDVQGDADSFHAKPIWQRIIILAAGVAMNWILAIMLFTVVFIGGTRAVLEDIPPYARVEARAIEMTQVLDDSPAEKAGLKAGDRVVSIHGQIPTGFEDARRLIAEQKEASFSMEIERQGERKRLTLTPVFDERLGHPVIGVGLADVGRVSFSPPQAFRAAVRSTWGYSKAILGTFGDVVRNLVVNKTVNQDLAGPIGIAVMTGKVAEQGMMPLFQFAAILSINLAIINILPIPALDGGRIAFLFIEKIRRRPMRRALEAAIHNGAFVLLLLLMALVTAHDVSRYGGAIIRSVKDWVG